MSTRFDFPSSIRNRNTLSHQPRSIGTWSTGSQHGHITWQVQPSTMRPVNVHGMVSSPSSRASNGCVFKRSADVEGDDDRCPVSLARHKAREMLWEMERDACES